MTKFEELNATNSTIVEWRGKELRTVSDPHIGEFLKDFPGEELYGAGAIDWKENMYMVFWRITNPDSTDESEAADWDNPVAVCTITNG